MKVCIRKEQLNIIYMMLLASCFYFSVLPYILRVIGVKVESSYYKLEHYPLESFYLLLLLNISYFIVLAIVFYIVFFKQKGIKQYKIEVNLNYFIILLVILASVFLSFDYLSLMRYEIKEASSLGIETLFLLTLTLISYSTLTTKKKLVLLLNVLLVLYFSFVLFEREVILYALVPFFLRIGLTKKTALRFLVLFGGLALIILNYKMVINMIKDDNFHSYSVSSQKSPLYSLGVDSIHKMSLEMSYIEGDTPDYNHATIYVPYQVLRLFDVTRTTNARLATSYYTSNKTGTGFSFLLEGILNFSYFALLILPIILAVVFRLFFDFFGMISITPFVVFIVKIQRAELWPLLISTLIIPLVCAWVLFKLQQLLRPK